MINSRPGFRAYPIRKNVLLKDVEEHQQMMHTFKHTSSKSNNGRQDRNRKTPATEKSYKRNSMNFRKKKEFSDTLISS